MKSIIKEEQEGFIKKIVTKDSMVIKVYNAIANKPLG